MPESECIPGEFVLRDNLIHQLINVLRDIYNVIYGSKERSWFM